MRLFVKCFIIFLVTVENLETSSAERETDDDRDRYTSFIRPSTENIGFSGTGGIEFFEGDMVLSESQRDEIERSRQTKKLRTSGVLIRRAQLSRGIHKWPKIPRKTGRVIVPYIFMDFEEKKFCKNFSKCSTKH